MTGRLRLGTGTSYIDERLIRLADPDCSGDAECQATAAYDHWVQNGRATGERIHIQGAVQSDGSVLMTRDLD